ncbi:amino acid ABC transporter permease [Marinobacterium lutimaris]|uniref:Amino acid ABC transporter membrane protein 2, PAAT family n=1 Tax=Marinobacterium lutimaris TaxID=568106 RepID=A0A1H6D7V4_9GAMM|nr:ABC transporter permease subunit [Marinobacterium lutimaris]SEG80943.1 amino acid ABC transporter membrane protein 2, PAAT family [Marinobacterium lutimaris]
MNLSDFQIIYDERDSVITGIQTTLSLVLVSGLASVLFGLILTPLFFSKVGWVRGSIEWLCSAMRCSPFLLFVYVIYFGLPSYGINFDKYTSGLVAMIVYHSAYMAIIFRSAWVDIPAEILEAGTAYGFRGATLIRRIIGPLLLMRAIPMVGNQWIQIVKDSAYLGIISVFDITAAFNSIQSIYFNPFVCFIVAGLLYWVFCLLIELIVNLVARYARERIA